MIFSAPAAAIGFLARVFVVYLFLKYNPWLTKPPNQNPTPAPQEDPAAAGWMWPKSQFWKQENFEMEISDEGMGGCVEMDDYLPITSIEKIITFNETCHSTPKATDHRVVNGQPVSMGSRLYQVALFRRNRFACGGSFVSRRFILTAAHCVDGYRPQELKVRYATRRYETGPIMSVLSVIKHPGYNSTSVQNDIALLRLAYPLPRIPLLLDRVELNQEVADVLAANQSVVVSGWGRTGRSLPVSKRLLMANLKTVENKQCQEKWGSMFKVHPKSMICASDPEKSACNGDSGGPLTLNDKLIGIVSVGSSSCLSVRRPNVYTNVAYYYHWIVDTINLY